LLSGDSYVTCSLIVPSIKYLQKHLSKTKTGTPTFFIELKASLLESLNEYSMSYKLEEDPYLLCATFLDPNYKCFQIFNATEKKFMKIVNVIKFHQHHIYQNINNVLINVMLMKFNNISRASLSKIKII
jgi:hypothetical protein